MPAPAKLAKNTGLRRLFLAGHHSKAGLADAWRREEAFRIETTLLMISIPLAFWLGATISQTFLLIFSILFLMIVEILNSAIETVVDRIGPEQHELSRVAKDMGSASVLLSALFPAVVWVTVTLGRLGLVTL